MLTEEQRLARKQGIGGSDIAAICGANPYRTALDIWNDKTSESLPVEEDNMNLSVGNALESVVAEAYKRHRNEGKIDFAKVGIELSECDTYHDCVHPFLFANIDRRISDGGILEVKCAVNYGSQKQWKEGIPDFHKYQIAYYAAILEAPYVDVAVLCVGEKTPHYYRYERDFQFEKHILEMAVNFWNNYVIPHIHPVYGTKNFDVPTCASSIQTDNKIMESLNYLRTIRIQIKQFTDVETNLKEQIINFMGANETMVDESGNVLAAYKPQIRNTFDTSTFKKAHADLYDQFCKESKPIRVLRIND